MDVIVWGALVSFSIVFAALSFYLYTHDSRVISIFLFLIVSTAFIVTGLATISEGVEVINGSRVSENWTYEESTCSYTWSNGTDLFTDNSTCLFANASVKEEVISFNTIDDQFTQGFALLLILTGLALGFFTVVNITELRRIRL